MKLTKTQKTKITSFLNKHSKAWDYEPMFRFADEDNNTNLYVDGETYNLVNGEEEYFINSCSKYHSLLDTMGLYEEPYNTSIRRFCDK